jgi:hypothetical protein
MKVKKLRFKSFADKGKILVTDSKNEVYEIELTKDTLTDILTTLNTPSDDSHKVYTIKDIQRKTLQGVTPAQISKISGWELSRIERFSHTIEEEKTMAIRRFRTIIMDKNNPVTIDNIIARSLLDRDLSINDIVWSATRIDNFPWKIKAKLDNSLEAIFTVDFEKNIVEAVNDDAKILFGIEIEIEAPVPDAATTPSAEAATPSETKENVGNEPAKEEELSDVLVEEYVEYNTEQVNPVTPTPAPKPVKVKQPEIAKTTPSAEAATQTTPSPIGATPSETKGNEPVVEPAPEIAADQSSSNDELSTKPVKEKKPVVEVDKRDATATRSQRMKVPSWEDIIL